MENESLPLNQKRVFHNEGESLLLLMVEPVGEDYWILPNGALVFHFAGQTEDIEVVAGKDMFGVERGEHILSLYPPDCYDWAFYEGETAVECGHNRPEGWADALQAKYDAVVKRISSSHLSNES